MINILVIFGTRPEAIKLAPVIKNLEKDTRHFRTLVCTTAQHREMLDQVLSVFDIKPDYDLGVMEPKQSLTDVTAKGLRKIEEILIQERPDLILVQGDTTTTFAASLAAFYHKIRIGHVEAGLRTFNKYQPFPEEINRRLTTVLADYHFAPTLRSKQNLLREGIDKRSIVVTGNTGIDALYMALERIRSMGWRDPSLDCEPIAWNGKRIILVTAHRRENFGEPFEQICRALVEIVKRNPDVMAVYPVHLNPNVKKPVFRILGDCKQIHLVEPLDYLSFIQVMDKAYLILTDSGGIQEEAPALGKPVLVMRNTTERPEAVDAGTARLVGTGAQTIVSEAQRLLDDPNEYKRMSQIRNPFGDGKASQRIMHHILQSF